MDINLVSLGGYKIGEGHLWFFDILFINIVGLDVGCRVLCVAHCMFGIYGVRTAMATPQLGSNPRPLRTGRKSPGHGHPLLRHAYARSIKSKYYSEPSSPDVQLEGSVTFYQVVWMDHQVPAILCDLGEIGNLLGTVVCDCGNIGNGPQCIHALVILKYWKMPRMLFWYHGNIGNLIASLFLACLNLALGNRDCYSMFNIWLCRPIHYAPQTGITVLCLLTASKSKRHWSEITLFRTLGSICPWQNNPFPGHLGAFGI